MKNQQHVLIFGANGGLGTAVADLFVERGWVIVAPDREEVDVLNKQSVAGFITSLHTAPFAVVNLVGGIRTASDISQHTVEEFDMMVNLNLRTTFNVCAEAFASMKTSGGGSIVTVSAQSVAHPIGGRALYSATKAAVQSLTMSIAEEGKPLFIRANAIVPSIIKTAANLEWAEPGQADTWVTPSEVAVAIEFLCKPECAVNGTCVQMFGGISF